MTLLTEQWLSWNLLLCKNSNYIRNWELCTYCKLFINNSFCRAMTALSLLLCKNSNFIENWLFWDLLLYKSNNSLRNWEFCTYCTCLQITLFTEQWLFWDLLLCLRIICTLLKSKPSVQLSIYAKNIISTSKTQY